MVRSLHLQFSMLLSFCFTELSCVSLKNYIFSEKFAKENLILKYQTHGLKTFLVATGGALLN